VHVQMLHAPQVTFWCCLVVIACVGLPGTQYSLCMCAVLRMDPKSVTQYGRPLGNGETTHFGETGARNVQVKGHEHGLVRKEKTFMHMMDVWIQLRTRHLRTRGPLRTRQGRCAEVIHCLGEKTILFFVCFRGYFPLCRPAADSGRNSDIVGFLFA